MYNVGKLYSILTLFIVQESSLGRRKVRRRSAPGGGNQKLLLAAARNQSPEKSKAIIPTK